MKPLLIATTNLGKLHEFHGLLSDIFTITSLDKKAPKVIEDGKTYQANAEKKAKEYFRHYQVPILTDDSGLEVDALGGRPGVDSAIFGGEKLEWPERWNHLYQELAKQPLKDWTARFRCVLCYYDGKASHFFEGTTEGSISKTPVGLLGFGYDPLFYSRELKKSFGDATKEEKSQVSHRGRATLAFRNWAVKQP